MNVSDAFLVLSTMTHAEIGELTDSQLIEFKTMARMALDSTATHIARRKVETEDKQRHARQLAKRAAMVAINQKVMTVEELPEYKNLQILAMALIHSKKRADGNADQLNGKIEAILELHGLNDKRTIAHLINVAS